MKKIMLFAFLFFSSFSYSQIATRYDEIKLENASDYKAADTLALTAAHFLLSSPFEKNNEERLRALKFLIKWMAGTPDYSFSPSADITGGNEELTDLYMACLAKFCLENKSHSKNKKIVKLNAVKLLLRYCEEPNNNLRITGYLKKLAEAEQKGELEKVL